jgi:hypothetical protein
LLNRFCEFNEKSNQDKDESIDDDNVFTNFNLIKEWNQTKPVKEMSLAQFNVLVKNTNFELEVISNKKSSIIFFILNSES